MKSNCLRCQRADTARLKGAEGMFELIIAAVIGATVGYGAREYIFRKRRAAEWSRRETGL